MPLIPLDHSPAAVLGMDPDALPMRRGWEEHRAVFAGGDRLGKNSFSPCGRRCRRSRRMRGRAALSERLQDHIQNGVGPVLHVRIRKAKHAKTLLAQPRVACGVALGIVMRAVRLDDPSALETDEIRDIGPDRHLPSKLDPAKPPIPQKFPQQALGEHWRFAE